MSDVDSDEELNRAIALSLQESSPPTKRGLNEVIDLVSDEEEDDLDAPVVTRSIPSPSKLQRKADIKPNGLNTVDLTENEQQKNGESQNKSMALGSATFEQSIPVRSEPPTGGGILGLLDRKQMEEERIARAKQRLQQTEAGDSTKPELSRKRKASGSPESSVRKGRVPIAEALRTPSLVKEQEQISKVAAVHPSASSNTLSSQKNAEAHQHTSPDKSHQTKPLDASSHRDKKTISSIQYPDGVVKKTWAYGYPRKGNDIKIEEVLQKSDLELAVLSAFQVDPEWVQTKLDDKTKVIWVLQAKEEADKDNMRSGAPSNYKFCFPPMDGNVNCMHSKLQLLAHPTHLRIVIPSANLVPYDWGETGVMENVCFLIDLPRLPNGKVTEDSDLTLFGTELIYFLEKMGLGQATINSIKKFDFSRTAHLAFVHSIGGSHRGSDWKRTGFCGLGTAVRKLGLHTGQALSADFLTASLGNLNNSFMKSMFLALQGDDGMTEYSWRYNKPPRGQINTESLTERKLLEDLKQNCRVYFPVRETVASSRGGVRSAGTICFNAKWYNSDEFPRSLMRDCKSLREGMLMHSKMIFVRPHEAPRSGVAWAYVGSANLSESAWGRLVKDKSTKEPKLNCRNWECGVIVPVLAGDSKVKNKEQDQGPPGMEVFKDHVPVPMVAPGEEYAGRRPWYHNELDR
ncbi:uncharacterized protein BP5553_07143 [Venustampulla echinocandica]|uniref:PLD phosphodiesterase domain-containing protein n=1 Tax=Venustampulla echinocandica TaxID=2656787 RepID=A0A370TIP3_9HELO|nr:uncharacterized protein BP5553_07143 [Venustampulla echinocandica]RDL35212.1 hypothetical protein BP5553_07143 [Venustampulla echinocandica]